MSGTSKVNKDLDQGLVGYFSYFLAEELQIRVVFCIRRPSSGQFSDWIRQDLVKMFTTDVG